MRFVLLLGFSMIAYRLAPSPNGITPMIVLLTFVGLMDITDFVLNIIKTFRRK